MLPVPEILLPWLSCETSLTTKLLEKTGDARVNVVQQQWVRAGWWEDHVLGLNSQAVLQREIEVRSGNIACWYARTIIQEQTYKTHSEFFARLRHESLGELIYNEPSIHRSNLRYYPLSCEHIEFYWPFSVKPDKNTVLWARQSYFLISGQDPFHLVEIFLPEFTEVLA